MKVIQCADDWFMKNWSETKRIIFMQAYMYHIATGNTLLLVPGFGKLFFTAFV